MQGPHLQQERFYIAIPADMIKKKVVLFPVAIQNLMGIFLCIINQLLAVVVISFPWCSHTFTFTALGRQPFPEQCTKVIQK